MSGISEDVLEQVALEWFAELGYEILDGPEIGPEGSAPERESFEDPILEGRLRMALEHLNRDLPVVAIDEAIQALRRLDAPSVELNNEAFHQLLTDGIPVELPSQQGHVRAVNVRLFDFEHPEENNWLAVRQFQMVDRALGTGRPRRPDIVVFVNGLPLGVLELKDPEDENADVWKAYQDHRTKIRDIPGLFAYNAVLVASDDVEARIGSLTAPPSRFLRWRTIEGQELAPASKQPLEVLICGVFEPSRFLELVRNSTVFVRDRGKLVKILAAYHQFHAARAAVAHTVRACAPDGDRKAGVVWHTQGSGKSLTMLFYAGQLVLHPAMENPTIVVITDRNDLDDQLFTTFCHGEALLRQTPKQAEDRKHLRELLKTASGGVYFTTIQKFFSEDREEHPALSDRSNIVVIADEAHRSQYGFRGKLDHSKGSLTFGYAKYMRDALPNASFIGFTGTPIEQSDADTRKVFGADISVYDVQRAVDDKATVPIYYENRSVRLELNADSKPKIDPKFEEVTENEEEARRERLKSEWSALEKLVGADKRIRLVAADLVKHFEMRLETLDGKALVVGMSREICVDLYEAIRKLRPQWHDDDDARGQIKVVMTGSASDKQKLQPHLRSKRGRERIAERFKDPSDPLKVVIVRDMWLTGFDVPCLHTMYVDKPMRGHNLMQAIARVNRVFGDKPGGLVVDYIGIATFLKEALKTYSASGGRGDPTLQQDKAVRLMLEKLDICRDLFSKFDYSAFFSGAPRDRLALLPGAREHILKKRTKATTGRKKRRKGKADKDDYERFLETVKALSQAFTLAMPHDECERVRDEVAFFQAVRAGLVKLSRPGPTRTGTIEQAMRQIVSNAIVAEDVIDIFDAAGLKKPDISILSDEFLAEVQGMKHRNLAVELLNRLLSNELRRDRRASVVQSRRFSEMLEKAIKRYRNRNIEAAKVIEELIRLARAMREASARGDELGLAKDELFFYEALAENESARDVLGDKELAGIARELIRLVRKNATIDWQYKRSVQAKLRSLVRRLLKKHGYPPDASEKATQTVLEQARRIAEETPGASKAAGEPGAWAQPMSDEGQRAAAEAVDGYPTADSYPFPMAIFESLVLSQPNAAARVRTRLSGVETTLALLAASELALLRQQRGSLDEEARQILGVPAKRVAMGHWLQCARRLAALLPARSNHPIARAARSLISEHGKPSPLALEIESTAVKLRNELAHGTPPPDEAIAKHEIPLADLHRRLQRSLAPLAQLELVSLANVARVNTDGSHTYALRLHRGPNEIFPIHEAKLHAILAEDWAYLRHGDDILSLEPLVSCRFNDTTKRHELYIANTLAFDPGAKIELKSLPGNHKIKVKLGE